MLEGDMIIIGMLLPFSKSIPQHVLGCILISELHYESRASAG